MRSYWWAGEIVSIHYLSCLLLQALLMTSWHCLCNHMLPIFWVTQITYASVCKLLVTVATACWKRPYDRGVGTIPTTCREGWELDGLLCYPKCRAGYSMTTANFFAQDCPPGHTQTVSLCTRCAGLCNTFRRKEKKRLRRLCLRGLRKCGCLRTSGRLWAHTTGVFSAKPCFVGSLPF